MQKLTPLAVFALGASLVPFGFTQEPSKVDRELTVILKEQDGTDRTLSPDNVFIQSGGQKFSLSQLVKRLDAVEAYSYRCGARDARTKKRLPVSVEFVEPRPLAVLREGEYKLGFPRPGVASTTDGPAVQYEWCDVEPSEVRIFSKGYKAVVRKVAPSLSEVVDLEAEDQAAER